MLTEGVCSFTWNPGAWPYIARCHLAEGHAGPHLSTRGTRYLPDHDTLDGATQHLLRVLTDPDYRGPSLHRDKLRTLALEWPTLAAALGMVVRASGAEVPSPLRRAMTVLAQENGT